MFHCVESEKYIYIYKDIFIIIIYKNNPFTFVAVQKCIEQLLSIITKWRKDFIFLL